MQPRIVGNPRTEDERKTLQRHIFATYASLRLGMGILAAGFPLALYIAGKLHGIALQGSMSAYYWAGAEGMVAPRTLFVGGLLALAAFFYLYKGFTLAENFALNAAAVFAALVACFPMSWNSAPPFLPPVNVIYAPAFNPHGTCAVLLFLCLAYVSLFRAHDTLPALENKTLQRRYKAIYRATGTLMLVSPLTAAVLRQGFNRLDAYTYFIELAGVTAFAAYWIAKSMELRHTKLVERVLGVGH